MAARAAVAWALICAAACSSPGASGPCGFLGSTSAAPELQLLAVRSDTSVVPLNDGDSIAILTPPQGGRVVFVGVRATNLDGCGVQLNGGLVDPKTTQVRPDSRTVNLTPTSDGWGVSGSAHGSAAGAISSFLNIPVCPNQWSTTDIEGNDYGLEVIVTDREGRKATKSIRVTPECGEPANLEQCQCLCRANYVTSQTCPVDGGKDVQ